LLILLINILTILRFILAKPISKDPTTLTLEEGCQIFYKIIDNNDWICCKEDNTNNYIKCENDHIIGL